MLQRSLVLSAAIAAFTLLGSANDVTAAGHGGGGHGGGGHGGGFHGGGFHGGGHGGVGHWGGSRGGWGRGGWGGRGWGGGGRGWGWGGRGWGWGGRGWGWGGRGWGGRWGGWGRGWGWRGYGWGWPYWGWGWGWPSGYGGYGYSPDYYYSDYDYGYPYDAGSWINYGLSYLRPRYSYPGYVSSYSVPPDSTTASYGAPTVIYGAARSSQSSSDLGMAQSSRRVDVLPPPRRVVSDGAEQRDQGQPGATYQYDGGPRNPVPLPPPDARPPDRPVDRGPADGDVASSRASSRYRYGAFGDDTTGTSLARKRPVADPTTQTVRRPGG